MVLWKCAACFILFILANCSRLAHMATALAFHHLANPLAVVFLFHYFAFFVLLRYFFGTTFGTTFLFLDTLLPLVTSAETPAVLQVFAVLTV